MPAALAADINREVRAVIENGMAEDIKTATVSDLLDARCQRSELATSTNITLEQVKAEAACTYSGTRTSRAYVQGWGRRAAGGEGGGGAHPMRQAAWLIGVQRSWEGCCVWGRSPPGLSPRLAWAVCPPEFVAASLRASALGHPPPPRTHAHRAAL
jgi:hypothetical protein